MIIGVDIDGTLTRRPNELISLAQAVHADGGQVYIITAVSEMEARRRLRKLSSSVFYDKIFAYGEAYNEKQVGKWKMRVCKTHKVDILFEDNPNYAQYGQTPVFLVT